ncbi:MAG: SRPBCC family protein [Proteobacteria bacterium]|nr:SRPBCC family protein [Pseudomonadota bacterium]
MSTFVYVTYIRTTPQKLWDALIKPEFTRQYWFGVHQESDWKKGSSWKMVYPDGRVTDAGEVVEIDPPNRLVLKWRHELRPELKEEGYSRCVMELQPDGDLMKLTITHSIERENSKLVEAVSGGWPKILSGLKSLLETGQTISPTHERPKAL